MTDDESSKRPSPTMPQKLQETKRDDLQENCLTLGMSRRRPLPKNNQRYSGSVSMLLFYVALISYP